MAAKTFKSKVDAWLVIVLAVSTVVLIAGLAATLYSRPDPLAVVVMLAATLLFLLLVGSILLRTYYRVDAGMLTIVSGPLRRSVAIDQITSVERTRNPLSSPALSLDRLRIRYGDNKSVMISPADRDKFLNALGIEETR